MHSINKNAVSRGWLGGGIGRRLESSVLNAEYRWNRCEIECISIAKRERERERKVTNIAKITCRVPPSSDVIRRRIPYQDLAVTLHHAEEKSWNTSKKTQTHDITQDFYQTTPTHNMKGKDRIVVTRLGTGHCKLTHVYLLKKKKRNRIPNVYPMQPNFINQSSSIWMQRVPRSKAKIQNNFTGSPDTSQKHIGNVLNYLKETDIYHKA